MATALHYTYRDASNSKQHSCVVFPDTLDEPARQQLADQLARACDDSAGGDQFIPQDVGLPPLQDRFTGFLNPDDHPWHELGLLDDVDLPVDAPCTLAELVLRFEHAAESGWPSAEMDEHDLAAMFDTFVCTYDDDGNALDPQGRKVG